MAVFAGLGVMGMVAAERPMQAAGQAKPRLQPTPLVLKDGRIANVSIHEVPFARGRADITPQARANLAELTRAVATDCFLTAQVIGHIESSEVADDDTLSAHRLARSRADAVQASLIDRGLPAKAIASVWDWQFMVREARATLWIFELTAGEDCEGQSLQPDLVAQAPEPKGQQASPEPKREAIASAVAPDESAPARQAADTQRQQALPEPIPTRQAAEGQRQQALPESAPARQAAEGQRPQVSPAPTPARQAAENQRQETSPEPPRHAIVSALAPAEIPTARRAAEAQVVAPQPSPEPMPARPQAVKEEAHAGAPRVTQPLPAPARQPAASEQPTNRAVAAVARDAAKSPQRVSKAAATDEKVETDPDGGLVIIFATNSSYFPPGARKRLNQMLSEIEAGKRYEVSLQAAVSGTTKVVGAKSPEEARRYNKWLAERRLERVQQWLLEHASPDAVSIRPQYLGDDESRRVVVRMVPVG